MNRDSTVRSAITVTVATFPVGTAARTPAVGGVNGQGVPIEGTTTGETAGTASGPISAIVPLVLVLVLVLVVLVARYRGD